MLWARPKEGPSLSPFVGGHLLTSERLTVGNLKHTTNGRMRQILSAYGVRVKEYPAFFAQYCQWRVCGGTQNAARFSSCVCRCAIRPVLTASEFHTHPFFVFRLPRVLKTVFRLAELKVFIRRGN